VCSERKLFSLIAFQKFVVDLHVFILQNVNFPSYHMVALKDGRGLRTVSCTLFENIQDIRLLFGPRFIFYKCGVRNVTDFMRFVPCLLNLYC